MFSRTRNCDLADLHMEQIHKNANGIGNVVNQVRGHSKGYLDIKLYKSGGKGTALAFDKGVSWDDKKWLLNLCDQTVSSNRRSFAKILGVPQEDLRQIYFGFKSFWSFGSQTMGYSWKQLLGKIKNLSRDHDFKNYIMVNKDQKSWS